ncbi:ACP S-malonyltransferase [Streptomyces laculatispora]|uniref:[acyl-carrier-protein] S-malonyltransferase n=1 Tax=Streptomyces laculatispora TaxID=887464 RepID=A0ABY9IGC4_9ACTN|nr:ACP S-malonyltransferase [Streptomyces laculatispora]WLQ45269.1 ACP S-malonyltransferase [Streptomyces laculatispora]
MLINPVARRLVADADDALGYSLVDRYREAEGDYSEYAQVAFLVNCLALAVWAHDRFDPEPELCVGPSFGGKTAAAHTGVLDFADAVRLTAGWARLLESWFAENHQDVVTHSFTRVPRPELDRVLAELDERGEWYELSCQVDEDFHMVSLRAPVLDWLGKRLRSVGGLPLYTMRPPMHASVFAPLRERAEKELFAPLTFHDPRIPVVADQDGTLLTTGEQVRTMLLDGFVRPVRWPVVVDALRRHGVGRLYVAGPDSLFGRVPVTTRNFDVVAVDPRAALRPVRRSLAA